MSRELLSDLPQLVSRTVPNKNYYLLVVWLLCFLVALLIVRLFRRRIYKRNQRIRDKLYTKKKELKLAIAAYLKKKMEEKEWTKEKT